MQQSRWGAVNSNRRPDRAPSPPPKFPIHHPHMPATMPVLLYYPGSLFSIFPFFGTALLQYLYPKKTRHDPNKTTSNRFINSTCLSVPANPHPHARCYGTFLALLVLTMPAFSMALSERESYGEAITNPLTGLFWSQFLFAFFEEKKRRRKTRRRKRKKGGAILRPVDKI